MSRKLSEEECYVCEVCDGSWQGVNEQNGEFKCYHCSEAQKHLYAVKIMKADLDSCVTEIANLKAQMPQWVSVDDKLPPIGETVLWFYCGKDSDKKVTLHRMDISAKKFALTKAYWMPLPPAPTA